MQADNGSTRSLAGSFVHKTLKPIYYSLLDLVFPPTCLHCERVDSTFCDVCCKTLETAPIVPYQSQVPHLEAASASALHEGIVQAAVQALKYHQQRSLAPILAKRLVRLLANMTWTYDIIVPVPMHTQRLRERGYNQAKEISMALAAAVHRPHVDGLQRIRQTRSQVGLTRNERLHNLAEAFAADASLVSEKTVLLVDDVQTTGATMAGCARAAHEAGAQAVYGITVTAARI